MTEESPSIQKRHWFLNKPEISRVRKRYLMNLEGKPTKYTAIRRIHFWDVSWRWNPLWNWCQTGWRLTPGNSSEQGYRVNFPGAGSAHQKRKVTPGKASTKMGKGIGDPLLPENQVAQTAIEAFFHHVLTLLRKIPINWQPSSRLFPCFKLRFNSHLPCLPAVFGIRDISWDPWKSMKIWNWKLRTFLQRTFRFL